MTVSDRAFFQREGRWVDSNLIARNANLEPAETYQLGSEGHAKILGILVKEGRQALLSLQGEILLEVDGKNILIKNNDQ